MSRVQFYGKWGDPCNCKIKRHVPRQPWQKIDIIILSKRTYIFEIRIVGGKHSAYRTFYVQLIYHVNHELEDKYERLQEVEKQTRNQKMQQDHQQPTPSKFDKKAAHFHDRLTPLKSMKM